MRQRLVPVVHLRELAGAVDQALLGERLVPGAHADRPAWQVAECLQRVLRGAVDVREERELVTLPDGCLDADAAAVVRRSEDMAREPVARAEPAGARLASPPLRRLLGVHL